MESVNFFKGYDKVKPSQHHPISPQNRRRRIIAISLAVLATLIIGSLVAAVVHRSATGSNKSEFDPSQLASNSADSLRTVCAVTRYPDSCFSSISPLNSPPSNNPFHFFNLSLHASLNEISNLKTLLTESKADPAMKDCAELFDDSASQLRRSAESICGGRGEKVLTEMRISDLQTRISDLQTWISAAMTDQETCVDGLAETGSTAVVDSKMKVQRSQEYMSNTLAILNNIQSLFQKFGLTMP